MKKWIILPLVVIVLLCVYWSRPLEIVPMAQDTVELERDSVWRLRERVIPGFYYVKHFRDNKKYIKELLTYIQDTLSKRVPFNACETHLITICRRNVKLEKEGDVFYTDDKRKYIVILDDEYPNYFSVFHTWSKNPIGDERLEQLPHSIVQKVDRCEVSFDYDEFDTDTFQDFITIASTTFDNSPPRVDSTTRIPDTCYLKYVLINPNTQQQECIISFNAKGRKNKFLMPFSIEIL